jgi:hypothetical protein
MCTHVSTVHEANKIAALFLSRLLFSLVCTVDGSWQGQSSSVHNINASLFTIGGTE